MTPMQARLIGARLGVLQGGAIWGTPATLLLFAADHLFLALLMAITAALGWFGWWRDYRLAWRPWEESA